MRAGFELLVTRSFQDKVDLNRIEEEFKINLPPLFSVFLETFELTLQQSQNFIAYCPDEEVGFDDFQSNIDRNIQILNSEESYLNSLMLPFASSGIHSGGICVCIDANNLDKIFVNDEMVDGKFRLIANNIFEFIRGLIEVEDGDDPSIYLSPSKT